MKIIYIIIIFLLQGCAPGNTDKDEGESTAEKTRLENEAIIVEEETIIQPEEYVEIFDTASHLKKYKRLKTQIRAYQRKLKSRSDVNPSEKVEIVENYFNEMLIDSLFKYWIGTEWDFNGYTEKPRDGEIACGYFVSTTLRDLGISINRFKIAQKAASDIIDALCDPASIVKLSSLEQVNEFLKDINENEILIVGLDNHVGFIFKRDQQSYFAHSNYINRKGVEIESLNDSAAFGSSNLYVIGSLTKNKEIIKKWLR